MANDVIFVNGMKVKERFENLLGVSIKLENFEWFMEKYANKGYLNIDICKSKTGQWYAKLNTWKPTKSNNEVTEEDIVDEFDGTIFDEDDIVF